MKRDRGYCAFQILVIAILLLLSISCKQDSPAPLNGELNISLTQESINVTYGPVPEKMNIARYIFYYKSSANSGFSQVSFAYDKNKISYSLSNLPQGSYVYYAEGVNSDGTPIYRTDIYETNIGASSYHVNLVSKVISSGRGKLSCTLKVPKSIEACTMKVSVFGNGIPDNEKTFTVPFSESSLVGDERVFSLQEDVEVGTYTVSINCLDETGNSQYGESFAVLGIFNELETKVSTVMDESYLPSTSRPYLSHTSGAILPYQTEIEILCATENAKIFYTLDGTSPEDNGIPYTGPIQLSSNTTIKATAKADGFSTSECLDAKIYIKAPEPTINIENGTYDGPQSVTISCLEGMSVHYSINDGGYNKYEGEFVVDSNSEIKAYAESDANYQSEIVTKDVKIKAAVPVFSLSGGEYIGYQTVILSAASGSRIFYTMNGTDPVSSGIEYTSPIPLEKSCTIRAYATEDNKEASDIISADYIIGAPKPMFSNVSTEVRNPFNLTIVCTNKNAAIYYTLNGEDPTINSTRYTGPISISATTTVKAIAIVDQIASETAEITYTFKKESGSFDVVDPESYVLTPCYPDGIEKYGDLDLSGDNTYEFSVNIEPNPENAVYVWYVDGQVVSGESNNLLLIEKNGESQIGEGLVNIAVEVLIGDLHYTEQFFVNIER